MSLLETYMAFGGIPFYWSLLNRNLSTAQNISRLCFEPGAELKEEFRNLFASLFNRSERHEKVVEILGKRKVGLTRQDIGQATGIPEGGSLSVVLEELELSGFIRKYTPFTKRVRGSLYQLVDHFSLFHLAFIKGASASSSDYWMKKRETQVFRTWRGFAFERVCLSHIPQIERALGISGVITSIESWRSTQSIPGAQIDLLINRNDNAISLCEMKFTDSELALTRKMAEDIRYKRSVFIAETGTRKAVYIALITPRGLKRNDYYDLAQSIVTADDLLRE
jgi:hypothetical protein